MFGELLRMTAIMYKLTLECIPVSDCKRNFIERRGAAILMTFNVLLKEADEKLKKIVDREPNPEDIIELPWAMTRELDIDNMLLLLRALDGALYPLSL